MKNIVNELAKLSADTDALTKNHEAALAAANARRAELSAVITKLEGLLARRDSLQAAIDKNSLALANSEQLVTALMAAHESNLDMGYGDQVPNYARLDVRFFHVASVPIIKDWIERNRKKISDLDAEIVAYSDEHDLDVVEVMQRLVEDRDARDEKRGAYLGSIRNRR